MMLKVQKSLDRFEVEYTHRFHPSLTLNQIAEEIKLIKGPKSLELFEGDPSTEYFDSVWRVETINLQPVLMKDDKLGLYQTTCLEIKFVRIATPCYFSGIKGLYNSISPEKAKLLIKAKNV